MNYRQFRRALTEEISRRSGEEIEISFRDMQSNNDIHAEAIMLGSGYGKFLPSIDMNILYQEYGKGVSVRHLAKLLIHQYQEVQKKYSIPGDFFASYERVSGRIYCKLVSRAQNAKLLAEVPNCSWADLAVIVYYRMEPTLFEGGTITIQREHLHRWGVDSEELFRNAWENTASAMHPVLRPLSNVLSELEKEEGAVHEEESASYKDDAEYGENAEYGEETESEEDNRRCPLYILTNQDKCYGAISIAIPGEAEMIAENIRSDYYVLPSSIHECLILPDDGSYKTEFLNELVRSVNDTQVDPSEVLSDHVYHYSRLCGGFDI